MSAEALKENRQPEEYKTLETMPLEEFAEQSGVHGGSGEEDQDLDHTEQVRSFFQSLESRKKLRLFPKRDRRNQSGLNSKTFSKSLIILFLMLSSFFVGKYNIADVNGYVDQGLDYLNAKSMINKLAVKLAAKPVRSKFSYKVAVGQVNVRSAPGNDSQIVGGLKTGEGVWVKSMDKDWVEVYKKRDQEAQTVYKVGYVFKEMLGDP